MADNFFCLDLGEKYTKVVDAKKTNELLDITALGKAETNQYFFASDVEKNIEDEAATIRKLVESLKINKKNVNIIIPGSFTYSQILLMPNLNEKELISAIKYQADQFIPMPIEEANIDLEIIQEFKEEKKILLLIVAAPKKLVQKIQNTVEMAGLIPESIENELSSSSRFVSSFSKSLIPQESGIVVANFGLNSTTLSYFEPGTNNLKESHNFSIGFQLFLKEIQVNTDSDQKKSAEILATFDPKNKSSYPVNTIAAPIIKEFGAEIKRFATGKKIAAIYFFNQIFLFSSLTQFVYEATAIPTSQLNAYMFAKKSPLLESYKNELSVYISSLGGNLR